MKGPLVGYKVLVASDVSERDGIGIEVYKDDEMLIAVFRDDTKRTRTVSLYRSDIALDLLEASIAEFKVAIPWDFIVDDGRAA